MKRIVKFLNLAFLPVMVFISLTGCMGTGTGPKSTEKPPTSVVITSPVPREIKRKVRFSGTLKGSKEVLVYPPLPGKFMGYTRSEGAYVSQGTTIAQIDRDIPGVSYEPVPVEASISGKFFTLGTSPGEMVAPQMPIARISETGTLKLEFNVPEKYVSSISQGSRAQLYVPNLDYTTTATLNRVSRFIDARTGVAQAEASVSNHQDKLAPGMSAEINVVVASQRASLAVPADCVLGLDGKFVYVLVDPATEIVTTLINTEDGVDTLIDTLMVGKAVKRDVEVGMDDGEFIEIVKGLDTNEKVIYVGQRIVDEGGKVKITDTYLPVEE